MYDIWTACILKLKHYNSSLTSIFRGRKVWSNFVSVSESWGASYRRGTSFSKLTSIKVVAWHQIMPLYGTSWQSGFFFVSINSASKCTMFAPTPQCIWTVLVCYWTVIEQLYSVASSGKTSICVSWVNKVLNIESFVLLCFLTCKWNLVLCMFLE